MRAGRLGWLVVALAALAPAAWAQDANPVAVTLAAEPEGPAVDAVAPKQLIGREVTGRGDVPLGEIEAVEVDGNGNVRRVVVRHADGGERFFALDWHTITVSSDGLEIGAPLSVKEALDLPPYRFADAAQQGTVFTAP